MRPLPCRWLLLLAALAGLAPLAGCASHRSSSPYAPQSESDRDGLKAQKLTQDAAAILDKDPAKAEKLLREALTADLYHGAAHNDLGVVYLKQGHLYEAASEFEWARKLLPGLPDPRMNLALTLERAGRTDEALVTYASALDIYPDHLPTLQALARLQIRSGRTDDRTKHALEEIELRGESERWREWAKVQRERLAP
jgi:Flp pilus assembly protein TadD